MVHCTEHHAKTSVGTRPEDSIAPSTRAEEDTHTNTDKHIDKHNYRHRHRHTDTDTHKHTHTHTCRPTDIYTGT